MKITSTSRGQLLPSELKLQLALLDIAFNVDDIDLGAIDWKRFFIEASNNRFLHYACHQIRKRALPVPSPYGDFIDSSILPKGDEYIRKTRKSLEFLNTVLNRENLPFLVCKTQKVFDYVSFDVDCLFSMEVLAKAIRALQESTPGKYVECESKKQCAILYEDRATLDMHAGFHWQGSDFIPSGQVWRNSERKTVYGIQNVLCPPITTEITLTLLNLIYERFYIPLIDYHYILVFKNEINWDEVFTTAEENHWIDGLTLCLEKFNQAHSLLFEEPLIAHPRLKISKKKMSHSVHFPFMFTWADIARIFCERAYKCKYIRVSDLTYIILAKTRYHIIDRYRVPIYGHWVDIKESL